MLRPAARPWGVVVGRAGDGSVHSGEGFWLRRGPGQVDGGCLPGGTERSRSVLRGLWASAGEERRYGAVGRRHTLESSKHQRSGRWRRLHALDRVDPERDLFRPGIWSLLSDVLDLWCSDARRWCGGARRWCGDALRRSGGARVWWRRWLLVALEVFTGKNGDWAGPLVFDPCWLCFAFCWFSYLFSVIALSVISSNRVLVGGSGLCASGLCASHCTLCACFALGRRRVPCICKWSLPLSSRGKLCVTGCSVQWHYDGKAMRMVIMLCCSRVADQVIFPLYHRCVNAVKANRVASRALFASWCFVEYKHLVETQDSISGYSTYCNQGFRLNVPPLYSTVSLIKAIKA